MIGQTIGHYRIESKIGAGGMGDVYLAHDTRLNRSLALKFLSLQHVADETFRTRFTREAQSAAAISHPNIVTIYEVAEHNGRPYMAMELVEGDTLRELINRDELPLSRILDIAVQACAGLEEAHGKGIIHRDVKPENMFLDRSGRVRLVDFGLARAQSDSHVTESGTTVGTFNYMSPEQASGQSTDQRTDLFSLGVVLFEMITGRLPWRGAYGAEKLYSLMNDQPEPLARYRSDVPDELQRIVTKLLEKAPEFRYQSAGGVTPDLKRLMSGSGPVATVAAVEGKLPPYRNRRIYLTAIAVAVVCVGLVLGFAFDLFRSGSEPVGDGSSGSNALAILHFNNLGDPSGDERLGQILQELLITDLSALTSIKVISSQRLFDIQKKLGYRDRSEIATELASEVALEAGASIMLSGNLWQDEAMWRMNCHLVDVASGTILKSQRVHGDDLYAMVDDISLRLRADLALAVDSFDQVDVPVREKTSTSIVAYRHYLDGVDLLNIGSLKPAIEAFGKAIQVDPTFNQAHYKLAFAQWWSRDIGSQEGKQSIVRILEEEYYTSERERQLALGALAMIEYRFTEALAIYRQLADEYPDDKETYFVLGLALLNESVMNRDEALAAFNRVIELDLTFVLAYREIYDVYMTHRDFQSATEMARDLITIHPEGLMGYRFLVEAALARGDSVQLELALRQALAHHKTPEELKGLYMHMGLVTNRISDHSASEKYTRMALAYDPDTTDWVIMAQLGDALFNQGKRNEAKRVWQKGLELNPSDSWCLGGLWYVAIGAGDYDRAIELAGKLIDMRPQSHRRYGELMEACARSYRLGAVDSVLAAGLKAIPSVPGKVALLLHTASITDIVLHNSRRAEQLYLQAAQLSSSDPGARGEGITPHGGLAQLYLRRRAYDKAEFHARQALLEDSLNVNALEYLFYSYVFRGDLDKALERAQVHVERNPRFGGSYGYLAAVYVASGDYAAADSVVDIVLRVEPKEGAQAAFLGQLAREYMAAGQLSRAEQLLRQALRRTPDHLPTTRNLGYVFELQGKYKEAKTQYERLEPLPVAIVGVPQGHQSELLSLGGLYLRQRQYENAEQAYRQALTLEKRQPLTLRGLGYLYCERGDFASARPFAEQAMALDSSGFSYALLAWVLAAGDFDPNRAIEFARHALEYPPADDPTDAYVWTLPYAPLPQHALGVALGKTEDYSQALRYLEEAAALRPEDPVIARDLGRVLEQQRGTEATGHG